MNDFVKRSKLINKLLQKSEGYRIDFKNAFYNEVYGVKMQCAIIDGNYGFCFKNDLDLPMTTSTINFERVLPENWRAFEKCEFDLAEIKTTLKLSKAKKERVTSRGHPF